MSEQKSVAITPYRNIPFDIGCNIDELLMSRIKEYLVKEEKAVAIQVSGILKNLSADILCAFQILPEIRLYIYNYGIGIFTVKDSEESFSALNYAVEYCDSRRKAHRDYLNIANDSSKTLYNIAENIRVLAKREKKNLRPSADSAWESHGFSYVMTVGFVDLKNGNNNYNEMTDEEKINLHIMLDPGIAHKEDSAIYSNITIADSGNSLNVELSSLEAPTDWIRSPELSMYISWSAVLLYSSRREAMNSNIVEALEVDLQSMWLYTYCVYDNLKKYKSSHKILASKLRSDLYKFKRKYNEFINLGDSNVPDYVAKMRAELIRTSGIESYAVQYMEYIEYCIAETESINAEKQKKYSWLNEILLFIIAFVQIAPMLYELMTGGVQNIQIWPVIVMVLIVIAAIIVIVRKD